MFGVVTIYVKEAGIADHQAKKSPRRGTGFSKQLEADLLKPQGTRW
jgi:hypothetical protein